MTADDWIRDAIDLGVREGLVALEPLQRWVFLISEAEVRSDMGGGIEALVRTYGAGVLPELTAAFAAIGATAISLRLHEFSQSPADEAVEYRATALISERSGYDYEAIRRVVDAEWARAR